MHRLLLVTATLTCLTGCTSLSSVTVKFIDWCTSNDATTNWLYNVAESGVFTKPKELQSITGVSFIPSGWYIYDKKYIFTYNELSKTGTFYTSNYGTIQSPIFGIISSDYNSLTRSLFISQ